MLVLCACLGLAVGRAGAAGTIFWSSQFQDLLFDSQGQELDHSFAFEIGSFGSFIPTYANMSDWEANWKVFDRAVDGNGWFADDQFFFGAADHNDLGGSDSPAADPLDVFLAGEKAYFWVFNSKALAAGSEWALVTDSDFFSNTGDSWIFEDSSDPLYFGSDWMLEDADEIIVGGLLNVQGDGEFSTLPGAFTLQTAAVPEPGSALLFWLSCSTLLLRRVSKRLGILA
ncbi:MAG TPA: hypothetical protein DIT13_09935 [Verrucomicrobiales bacterium]|nr:hypothetical protein [Verrucomicrobiales bacterium]HRJ07074.1 hypothetical protein [Prosthecobacter sp.]HRK13158.1 hypothetical protein [Prosthecobacter sp.]